MNMRHNHQLNSTYLCIGIMSGTSMDGIDAALIKTDGEHHIELIAHHTIAYEPPFQQRLKAAETAVRKAAGDLRRAAADLDAEENQWTLEAMIRHSTQLHGLAVKQLLVLSGYSAHQISVIGYHGQTLLHQPHQGLSVIVGDGRALADDVCIPVVNDFRSQDMALGGQGAPFAPLYHQALAIRDQRFPLAVVNCGGIANVSLIVNADPNDLIAFDTGPGNALIDRLVRLRTEGRECMDQDGRYGLDGVVNVDVLKALFEKSLIVEGQSYFSKTPPKSLDSGDMQLIEELEDLALEDACKTLEVFTAQSIVESVVSVAADFPRHWVLAGGGWKNPVIVSALTEALEAKMGDQLILKHADEMGWHGQSLEAQMFGYYALRFLQNKAISFPGTTGAPYPVCGGHYSAPSSL